MRMLRQKRQRQVKLNRGLSAIPPFSCEAEHMGTHSCVCVCVRCTALLLLIWTCVPYPIAMPILWWLQTNIVQATSIQRAEHTQQKAADSHYSLPGIYHGQHKPSPGLLAILWWGLNGNDCCQRGAFKRQGTETGGERGGGALRSIGRCRRRLLNSFAFSFAVDNDAASAADLETLEPSCSPSPTIEGTFLFHLQSLSVADNQTKMSILMHAYARLSSSLSVHTLLEAITDGSCIMSWLIVWSIGKYSHELIHLS